MISQSLIDQFEQLEKDSGPVAPAQVPCKAMGQHPEGGGYISFDTDAQAQRAWELLPVRGERHQLLLGTDTSDPMIRTLPLSKQKN